jgi:aryl carrier-like protein
VEHHVRRCFAGARDVVAEVVTPVEAGRAPFLATFVWVDNVDNMDSEGREGIIAAPTEAFRAAIPAAETALQEAVPAYMVPAVFLPLTAVPLTATGKTDRRRLRELAAGLSRADIEAYTVPAAAKRQPATAAEQTLQGLWARVLNLPPDSIGADDSFFRLGGDSISAMRLAGAARADGCNLGVADVFNHPVLSRLAVAASSSCSEISVASEPTPFSLLSPGTYEQITLSLPFSKDILQDALPTTQLQADWVHSQQCTYFLLEIHGPVDLDRLRAACQYLCVKHPLLRSVFMPSDYGVLQVILRQLDTDMARFPSDQDPLAAAKSICRQDANTPLPLGTPPFKVSLVSRNDHHHVLITRLSHAQYDGVCLPVLYHDLAAAYQGEALHPAPNFSAYLQYRLSQRNQGVYQFWKEFLHDATMTTLDYSIIGGVDSSAIETAVHVTRRIPLPSPPPGITMATVVKTAWSYVLARLTHRTDLVFGHVVNGRSVPIPESDRILGPCVNIIPVRVILQPQWTAFDLLAHVQSQYSRLLPFETSEMRDIVEHCTSWSSRTRFGSIVQHQNITQNPHFSMEGAECMSTAVAFPPVTKEFYVVSEPDNDHLQVSISATTRMVDPVSAGQILGQVCDAISSFSGHSDQLLSLEN